MGAISHITVSGWVQVRPLVGALARERLLDLLVVLGYGIANSPGRLSVVTLHGLGGND